MGRMVSRREFHLDNPGHHGAGPNLRRAAVGHGAAVQNIDQRLPLVLRERLGTSRAVSLQDPIHSLLLPVAQPERHLGAVPFEETGNFRGRSSLHLRTTA